MNKNIKGGISETLSGICILMNSDYISGFTSEDYKPKDWDPYKLSNGRIIEVKDQPFQQIIFDFDGGDYSWSGFVKGFLYPDGKYLAKSHYVKEAKSLSESLNGTFHKIKKGIE